MRMRGVSHALAGGALLVVTAIGCMGVIGGDDPPTSQASGPGWPEFAPTQAFQLRRLTFEQYTNTIRSLLGVATDGAPSTEPVPSVAGFPAIGASSAAVSSAGVAKFEKAARYFAELAFGPDGPREQLVPCVPSSPSDSTCFTMFVTDFGLRAFRRPLTDDEVAAYAALAEDTATTLDDVWGGLAAVTTAFLQSPNFLYLVEAGEPDPADPARYRFTSYEMASRLSYFLTNDMPDDELFDAAASGELSTPEGVEVQAGRLLALPVARTSIRAFFSALFGLDGLPAMVRQAALFPKFTPTLGASMREETLLGLEAMVFDEDGDYRAAFDKNTTFVNAELAALYDLPAPTSGGFERVTLPSHRLGLLGQAGVLAPRDHNDGTDPTRRGLFVLTRLLCEDLPLAPPADLAIPPAPTGELTARERFAEHATNPVCASCHARTDPVGFSLEHFDAIGAYRETDRGMTIDDTGEIDGQTYQGLAGLGAILRGHPALGPCLIQSIYHVSIGHRSTEFDAPTFGSMVATFDGAGSRILPLVAAIVSSDGFRFMPEPTD
jgi:uncharacterized protein DUF1592/uncharacterized protein DUF1588/uncharacterized protein DUF1595/uncharacterized protein DUF1587/uncharacterized protein DUF1585